MKAIPLQFRKRSCWLSILLGRYPLLQRKICRTDNSFFINRTKGVANSLKYKFLLGFYFLTFLVAKAQNINGVAFPYKGSIATVTASASGSANVNVATMSTAWYGDNNCISGLIRGSYSVLSVGGTLTFNFTPSMSSVSFLVFGSDPGDIIKMTTNTANPKITLGGGCQSSFSTNVSGNEITLNHTNQWNTFVIVTISSSIPFSSLSVSTPTNNDAGLGLFFDQTQFGEACNVAGGVSIQQATCGIGGANANAALTLTATSGGATKVGYSAGNSYTGPDFSAATVVTTAPMVLSGTLTNPTTAQPYTIRVFKDATCYNDISAVLKPTLCITGNGSLSISPAQLSGNKGETVTFTVTLSNAGPDAVPNAQVRVPIPANTTLLTASPQQGTYSPGTQKWDVGTMPVGNKTMTVTLKMN